MLSILTKGEMASLYLLMLLFCYVFVFFALFIQTTVHFQLETEVLDFR